ncbi:MAG: cell division protein FtsL [Gammaproteobacteria bacterium]|nr:MAG: cell division protein FtsL [Gammaproteobacteria bacterium]
MSFLSRLTPLGIELPILVLTLLIIVSSMAVVYSKYLGRKEFVEIQQLETQRDLLNDEWGRLLLEQSTWANPARVEWQARTRLKMIVPTTNMTVLIQP